MEFVGVTAAAFSIAKTAKTVIRFVRLLFRAAKDASSIGEHMNYFAINFRNFAEVTRIAIKTLDDLYRQSQSSPVMRHMFEMRFFESMAEESSLLEIRVTDLENEIPKIKSRFDIITSFRWTRMKPDMEALFAPMTSVKTTMNLAINTIQLGNVSSVLGSRTAEQEREIAVLKNRIKEQMETIRQLRMKAQYIPPVTRRSTGASGTRTIDSQVTLCHLAKNMVESGRVPSSPPESFSFSKLKRKRHSQRSSHDSSRSSTPRHQRPRADSPVTQTPTSPSIVRNLRRHREEMEIQTSDESKEEAPDLPTQVDEGHMVIPQDLKALLVPISTPSTSRSASTSNSVSASTLSSGSAFPPSPTSTSAPEPANQLRVESTERPTSETRCNSSKRRKEIIQDRTDLNDTIVSGQVLTPSGSQMVEAYIDRRLRYNLMSRALQDQLGLAIQHHTGETVRQYDDRAWNSLGICKLRWGTNQIPYRCYVIEDLEKPLIFGRHVSVTI